MADGARWWRRKRLWRSAITALVVLGALSAWLVWRTSDDAYVPGERSEGLVDTLARGLPADAPAVRFADVAEQAGLRFKHFSGTRRNRLPEDMGSGVALGDVDGDGWTDVFLVNLVGSLPGSAAGRCALFRNLGNGRFEDVSIASGADLELMGNGALFADVDGDGDLDLFVAAYGSCRLLLNDGRGRFTEAADDAGISEHTGFWTGVAAGDPDRDGDIDLYVCGYVVYDESQTEGGGPSRQYGADIPALINPSNFAAERNLLLVNQGDGRFTEQAEAAGVANPEGRSLGASFADLDGDGWPDLYVANDVSDNALFLNQHDGTFVDGTSRALVGDYRGAMGLALADFDNDLDLDLFITHWVAQENALYVNITTDLAEVAQAPRVMFIDEGDRHGLGQVALREVGWATRFIDFDNDGRRDLFVVNGSTIPMSSDPTRLTPMRSHLFWNAGVERGFFELGEFAGDGFLARTVGRGGATFDFDRDGDEDLVLVSHGGPVQLLRNDTPGGRVLRVRLRQPRGNTYALGARLTVEAGGRRSFDEIGTQGSYLSQHDAGEVAFGLGDLGLVDAVTVVWPDGEVERAGPFPSDRLLTWVRGSAPRSEPLRGAAASAVDWKPRVAQQRKFYEHMRQATDLRVSVRMTEAAVEYAAALALWPGHLDGTYYLANCLVELGRGAEALALFEQLVSLDPDSTRSWMQLGRLHLPGGESGLVDLQAAHAGFRRAHELNPEESGPLVALGLANLLAGRVVQAGEQLADAAALNARSIEADYYLGYLAWRRGDRDLAARHLGDARSAADPQTASRSVSSEGDTASGQALLAPERGAPGPLQRWRSLLERPHDVDIEYGELALIP